MRKILIQIFGLVFILTFIGGISKNDSGKNSETINSSGSTAVKKIAEVISDKRLTSDFTNIKLFNFEKNITENDNASSFVSKASLMKIKPEITDAILNSHYENILFSIPVTKNTFMELELTQSFPFSDDFTIIEKNGFSNNVVKCSPGLHYNGIIKGNKNSTASISIFENFVMGIISDENGNYVLGSVKNPDNTNSQNYIFYNDADMLVKNNFKCENDNYESKLMKSFSDAKLSAENNSADNPTRLPVKVYFEADFKMYQDGNSNTQEVVNVISGFFNEVKTIYQNEGIPFEISSIGIWTVADPYRNLTDSYDVLLKFGGATQDDFQGNIAHFISTRTANLGGIAWIRVMCSQFNPNDSSGRFAFSNIEIGFNPYPTFSWTVQVVTHEMGHSLGSRHTHACVWPINGNIRAIDSCYNAEGGCFPQPRARIGTIMSYCHLWSAQQGGGINLALGFGQLPGDTIRLRYAQAHCLDQALNSSERPSTFDLKQNYPNPFNPNTVISFALPVESSVTIKIYDASGKLAAELMNNKYYDAGFYNILFDAGKYNLSSGIYFYKLSTEKFTLTKRMVFVK